MDDIDIIDWQEGTGDSVEIGYLNPNGQQCFGHCGNIGGHFGKKVDENPNWDAVSKGAMQ